MIGPIRPRSSVALLAAIVLATALTPVAALGPRPLGAPEAHAADPGLVKRVKGIRTLSHEVFGYLPYWRLDSTTAGQLRYDLVSTIGLFGIGIMHTGSLDTSWVGYKEYVGPDATAVTNAAHRAGVRVVPTFQLFDSGALTKMKTFLGSATAQERFITQSIALMKRRLADGASLDFEPMPRELTPQYLSFVKEFAARMRDEIPGSVLVNATSAGAPWELIEGLAPVVDHLFVMAYNYRWSGSTIAGAVAPLDNTTRTVKKHITRFLEFAPARKIILGVPYYGYDWPVTSPEPNATVRSNRDSYGGVSSISYTGARDFLAAHPEVPRQYDAREGSGFYSYWSAGDKTWRQVYFDDERSLRAKYDYAIAKGLGGVGMWTLQNDRGYDELWNLLRVKFYAPKHALVIRAAVKEVGERNDRVMATLQLRITNNGTVPESGPMLWTIRDTAGALVWSTRVDDVTLYPGEEIRMIRRITIGPSVDLAAGTYTLRAKLTTDTKRWWAKPTRFLQRY